MAVWDALGEPGVKGADGGGKRGRLGGGGRLWLFEGGKKGGGERLRYMAKMCRLWSGRLGFLQILPKSMMGFREWTFLCG